MGFDELTLGNPGALWLLLAVAGLGVMALIGRSLSARTRARLGRPPVLDALLSDRSPVATGTRDALLLAALALGVIALARPQYGMKDIEIRNSGIDVIVMLDVSKSMKVNDIVPDRLTASKLEIARLLDSMQGGRVALVPFAGIGFLQTPYTSDFGALKAYLDALDSRDMPIQGTAIGRAMDLALRVVEGRPLDGDEGASSADDVAPFPGSKHRAIVLFTDGENLTGDPMEVARRATALGIRVFTVGVGTGFGKPVPLLDDEGHHIGIQKEEDGKTPVYSALNEELLSAIAEETEGRYIHYDGRSIVPALYAGIDELEKQEYMERVVTLREERFQLALFPAAVFLALRLLLGTRRRRS